MTEADVWIRLAAMRCQDCISSENICRQVPKLIIHMYLSRLDEHNWAANLLSIKAFLLTQNLIKAQLWVWSDTCSDSGLVGPALALRHLSSGEPKAPEVLRSSEPVMPQYRQEVGCKVVCGEH